MENKLILCIVVAGFISTAFGMECYNCNTTFITERKDDACKGLEAITKCVDPSHCLTATLIFEDKTGKHYNAIKTCHIPQDGQECDNFLKNIQAINPLYKVDYYNKQCKTCDKSGCNKFSGATAVAVPTFLAFIISYILCKLI